ncbi:glycine--tRNA ligase [Treponema paraluiscuniculi]|nr:glycine--tRNA ligase [Treponema paraluiscuniculi]
MEKIVGLCKRRGFVFPSSEIYGGQGGVWDYGPMGIALKNNIAHAWWQDMTRLHDHIVGLDAAILMHPDVWRTSGHVDHFSDPLVDCTVCKSRFRADQVAVPSAGGPCPQCGGALTGVRNFNLMFSTHMGPTDERASLLYLRPETAQGIYVNYKNVLQTTRLKVPFGIAQIGKAFRNEIVTKNFIFRTCEFEQMEMQFFVRPAEDTHWFEYWCAQRWAFYQKYGVRMNHMRWRTHAAHELAHYARAACDIEYAFPMGFRELEGVHNRGDFDLTRHAQHSGKDLCYVDPDPNLDAAARRYVPCVVETSAGLTRCVLMFLCDAYTEEYVQAPNVAFSETTQTADQEGAARTGEMRIVLRLHPALSPTTVAFLPLVKKDGLVDLARAVRDELREDFACDFDAAGAIGKRYRRQDEVGTPFCVTVDYQSKEDDTVTVRLRDSMAQRRVSRAFLAEFLRTEIKHYRRP